MGFGGYLQANTAVDVLIGPFIDDTDGKTAETALTLSQGDIKLSKNGQALAQKNDDTAAAHDANGYYNCELDATDTNTEGTLTLIVHETGALPVRHDFMVLAQAAYISLVTAKDTGFMDVDVKAISTDTTAADNCELMFDGTGYGGGTTKLDVNVATIANNAITAAAIANGAIDNATFAADVGSTAYATNIIALAADKAIVNAALGTAAELAKVPKSDSNVSWNATALAAINAEVDTALNTAIPGSPTADSINERIVAIDAYGAPPSAATNASTTAAAILVTPAQKLVTDGSGYVTYSNAAPPSAATIAAAVLVTPAQKLVTDANGYVTYSNAAPPAASAIADAVWDEATSGHSTGGSTGAAIIAAGSAGDPWSTTIPGAYGAGTAGKIVGDNLNAPVATVDTVVDGIATTLGVAGAGLTAVPWNAAWDAEVQSEVIDALQTAISEMSQGIPPATPTMQQAIMYLYMAWRNKTETTATNLKVFNDAGTAIAQATLSDDATTFTKTEFISGA